MERRKVIKHLGIGAGAVAAGLVLPAVAAETWGPDGPEVDDPRQPSFWEEDAGTLPHSGTLESDQQVEVAIVGAGITGLSAAWTLKQLRPELKLCVIDSHRPGSGASSRNSAHLLPTYTNWKGILSSQGAEAAKAVNQFSHRGVEAAIDLFQSQNIDCNIHQEPLVMVAEKKQAKALEALYAKMKAAGISAKLYKGGELRARAGTRFYHSGIEVEDNYIMHPGKLMKGLLEKVMARGVPVYGHSPVLGVNNSSSNTETNVLKTPQASVAARQVLFATNAYTPRLRGLLASRMVPIIVATIATEPMSQAQKDALGLAWDHLTESKLVSRTIGHTPDRRIYLRGILGYRPFNSCVWKDLDSAYQRLERELRQIVPWAQGLKVEHKWFGAVAMTYSFMPITGPLPKKGQYVCGGYNGHGMAEGFYHARLVAHHMIGADHPDLKFLKGPAGWIPPEPHRSIGARTFFFFAL